MTEKILQEKVEVAFQMEFSQKKGSMEDFSFSMVCLRIKEAS